jgi:hypothetical protein
MKAKLAVLGVLLIAAVGCDILYVSNFPGKGPWGWDFLPYYGQGTLAIEGADLVVTSTEPADLVEVARALTISSPSTLTLHVTAVIDYIAPGYRVYGVFADSIDDPIKSCGFGVPTEEPGTYTFDLPLTADVIVFPLTNIGFRVEPHSGPATAGVVLKVKNVVLSTS